MATLQVRYIVRDVDTAIAFYCQHLGFREAMHPSPAFAMLSRGDLRLVLSQPNPSAGGGQAMPDGTPQEPGGWNRFAIEVEDLASLVTQLRAAGVPFRNEIVSGVGGSQILVQDPSGNLVELFQPKIPEARLKSGIPSGYPTVTPYLAVRGAREAIEFVQRAFDAEVKHLSARPDGTLMNAEVRIGTSMVMFGEASKDSTWPAMLYLYVENADDWYSRAIAAGGKSIREPEDQFYGDRVGAVEDASGNQWWIATRKEDLSDQDIARRAAHARR
jgi:uncharacterized glyoxalase superfamily protein PhnB